MSDQQEEKPADPATLPTLACEFNHARPSEPHDMRGDAALKFIAKHKLAPGSLFWLSDGDVRCKATLQKVAGFHSAVVHWGTMQEVVVRA